MTYLRTNQLIWIFRNHDDRKIMSASGSSRVVTKAALQKGSQEGVEVIVHKSYKKKSASASQSQEQTTSSSLPKNTKQNSKTVSLKSAKFEVMKFAMSSYKSQEKQDAKVALAIKLGAVPPKSKYVNYKALKEERQKEKEEAEQSSKMQALGKVMKKTSRKNPMTNMGKHRTNKGILGKYGKVSKKNFKKT